MREYPVRISVISQKGHCSAQHKVGDSWLLRESLLPGGLCIGAYSAIAPKLWTLHFGGEFPWCQDKDVTTVACPDADSPVVFELRRLRED